MAKELPRLATEKDRREEEGQELAVQEKNLREACH